MNIFANNKHYWLTLLVLQKAINTALCDVMRYSKKNPPKSPFKKGELGG